MSLSEDDSGANGTGTARPPPGKGVVGGLANGSELHHGQYRIISPLGQGGFGITYLANHTRLNIHVAIKEYFPRQFATRQGSQVHGSATADNLFEWGLERFLSEAEMQANLRHPRIAAVNDYFEANGTAYMVLDYVDGVSLEDWLVAKGASGPLQQELDQIAAPLLDAVAFVHGRGLLHRDIKPDNIMIRAEQDSQTGGLQPVLLDFGAARAALNGEVAKRRLTAIVTDGYSAPEQYLNDAAGQGAWSDIYSLGATFYRAVTGIRPPAAVSRPPSQPDDLLVGAKALRSDFRPAFLAAIDAATRLDPARRPRDVATFRQGLFAKTFSAIPSRPPAQALVWSTGHLGGRARIVAVAAPLVLLVAGTMTYMLWASPNPKPIGSPPKPASAVTGDVAPPQPTSGRVATTAPTQQPPAIPPADRPAVAPPATTGTSPVRPTAVPVDLRITLAKQQFRIGDAFNFTVETNRDCNFLVYTIGADDKVELHDPVTSRAFMGDPLLKAGGLYRRQYRVTQNRYAMMCCFCMMGS